MKIRESYKYCFISLVVGLLTGCASTRYTVNNAQYLYKNSLTPQESYEVRTSILLDTRTGKSWVLLPPKNADHTDSDFIWEPLPFNQAPDTLQQ